MDPEVTGIKPGPKDVLANLGPSLYREAYAKKRSLSAHLEALHPSKDFNDGMDGFQRLLSEAGVTTRSNPETGQWADEFEVFLAAPNMRALVPEWLQRQWRRISRIHTPSTRAAYASTDSASGTLMRPYDDDPRGRWNIEVAPAIPLAEIIAATRPIQGDAARSYYLDTNAAQSRMVRIAEGAAIPRVKLTGQQHLIRIHKFGRAMETTYEALRRMRIDIVSMHVQRMAVQAEIDKVAVAIDTIVNGDGNSGTSATVYDLTDLDADANVGELTLKAWLAFRMKFANPYFATTALAQEDVALQMLTLNTGSANLPLVTLMANIGAGFTPINPGLADGLRLGWTSDAPADKIVAFDRRNTLERITEVGADIQEVERFIQNQTELMTMTESEGYAIIDGNAARILNLAA